MEAATSKGLERVFWTGGSAPDPDSQYLAHPDAVELSTTAVTPGYGLALLEQAIADCGAGGRGMIHAPVGVASLWGAGGGLSQEGPRLVAPARGNVVVAGAGYPGSGKTGAAPAAGTAWAFATGMVQVRLGAIQILPETLGEALDRRTNELTYRAERSVSAVFDPCCGPFAVLIQLGTP
jgi:hypothetical protein